MSHSASPGDWLVTGSQQYAGTPALVGASTLEYGQLVAGTADLAGRLTALGLHHGQAVAVQLPSNWQLARMLYAALYLGVTMLPLDPALSARQRDRLLADTGCRLLIGGPASGIAGVACIPPDHLFSEKPSEMARPATDPQPLAGDAIQLVIATSGTSGQPKGVMLSAANLAASAAASEQRLGLVRDDSWLACLPLFHIGGLSILLRCLAVGARVLLHERFDSATVWGQIAAGAVSHISLVPVMLERLLDAAAGQPPPNTLRVILVGGGPLSRRLAQRAHAANWPLCVSYGMSETASQFATDCSAQAGLHAGLVGLPLPGYEVALAANGRIRVRGAAVMAGYANPRGGRGHGLDRGWFETGDLGTLDGQGRLRVIGRADDLLVSGGKNIHPAEVEERVQGCPDVTAVGITGRADPVWGTTLVALFTGEASPEALDSWSREHLPPAFRPREWIRVDALPLNPMGKLSRTALRALLEQQAPAATLATPEPREPD